MKLESAKDGGLDGDQDGEEGGGWEAGSSADGGRREED